MIMFESEIEKYILFFIVTKTTHKAYYSIGWWQNMHLVTLNGRSTFKFVIRMCECKYGEVRFGK